MDAEEFFNPKPKPPIQVSHYLHVPFAEKDEAKALGARWDATSKLWYVPEGKDADAFKKWMQ